MRRLGSVPETHKCDDDDDWIALEIIFPAKKNCANWTIRTKVTLLKLHF